MSTHLLSRLPHVFASKTVVDQCEARYENAWGPTRIEAPEPDLRGAAASRTVVFVAALVLIAAIGALAMAGRRNP